jgi:hypothetical protein
VLVEEINEASLLVFIHRDDLKGRNEGEGMGVAEIEEVAEIPLKAALPHKPVPAGKEN